MNISLSIFDVFASAVPGSVYLATSLYLAVRWGWVDVDDLAGLDTTFALVAAIVASYLLGQVPGPALRKGAERVRLYDGSVRTVQAEFQRRNPTVADRPFLHADPFTLLAGLRHLSPDSAAEVDRSRAAGIMMRSTSPALLIGAVIALVDAVGGAGDSRTAAAVAAGALLVLAVLALREGQRRSAWALIHTYECAVWFPEIDALLAPPPPDDRRVDDGT